MSRKRVVCYGSEVCHKPYCHYIWKMNPENRLEVTRYDALMHDCRICRYCNSMNYHLSAEDGTIRFYVNKKGMQFVKIKGALYVRTSLSCWKLVYVKSQEQLMLFHINKVPENFDFTHPQTCKYHRQADVPFEDSIAAYLHYIYEHDRVKGEINEGGSFTVYSGRKTRMLAKAYQKKQASKRLRDIFKSLEQENPEYKKLSIC